jgi:hypothetical protein
MIGQRLLRQAAERNSLTSASFATSRCRCPQFIGRWIAR